MSDWSTALVSLVLAGIPLWAVVVLALAVLVRRAVRGTASAPDELLGFDPSTGLIWAECQSTVCRGIATEHDHGDTGQVQCMRCGHTDAS